MKTVLFSFVKCPMENVDVFRKIGSKTFSCFLCFFIWGKAKVSKAALRKKTKANERQMNWHKMWLKNWQIWPKSDKLCNTRSGEKKGYRKLYMWRPNGNIFKVYHRDGDSSVKRYIGERRRERKIFIDWYESKGARSRRERKEGKFVCTRCFFSSGLRSASTVEGEIYEGETVPVKTQTRKKNERKSSWKSLFSLSLTHSRRVPHTPKSSQNKRHTA